MTVLARDATDEELERLLARVYVDGGYTDPAVATSMFAAAAVRARGTLVTARDDGVLIGMVVVVPPGSPALRLAKAGEAEMQLLAVAPEARGQGLGARLIAEALAIARDGGAARLVLWTQSSMHAAQRRYLDAGFTRMPTLDFQRGDRAFLVFARAC